ncbi:MAG TPA: hypothetical protein PLS03_12950 [Terrimicrobiaceae bacterium]|nr:hypothetical protein [Terrimicrobiaceae bacterium]
MKIFPRIESPCPKSWSSLVGDDKKRFCEQCGLHVHNLSAMNTAERAAFLSGNSERICVAYVAPPESRTVSARAAAFLYRAA